MCEAIRTAVVDDHHLFRCGVISTLAASPFIEVVGCGKNTSDALQLAKDLLPDVILVDLSMPGGGIKAIREIAQACPVVRIGVLSVSESDDDVVQSFAAGAHGYILKGVSGSVLCTIVRELGLGQGHVSPEIAAKLMQELRDKYSLLSTREEDILDLLVQETDIPDVAIVLGMTESMIGQFITNSIRRLQVLYRANEANNIRKSQ